MQNSRCIYDKLTESPKQRRQ